MVKRLRHRPFTAVSPVRIRVGSIDGRLAQLGEHLPYKQGVTGSSPVAPIAYFGPVVQMVRMPACHAGGRGFEAHPGRFPVRKQGNAGVAQSVEQLTCNQ